MPEFDYAGAVKAGFNSDQIAAYLQKAKSEGKDLFISHDSFVAGHKTERQAAAAKLNEGRTPVPETSGFQDTGGSLGFLKSRANQLNESLTRGEEGKQTGAETALQLAGNAGAGAFNDVTGKVVSPIIKASPVAPLFDWLGAGVEKVTSKLSPRTRDNVAAILNTSQAVATPKAIEKGLTRAKSAVAPVTDAAAVEARVIKDATPAYNKNLIKEPAVPRPDGTVSPRVQEGSFLKGRTVTPTKLEVEAGQALAKVHNYPSNGTSLQKFQAVQPEISTHAKVLDNVIQNEAYAPPKGEIIKTVADAIEKVPEESLLLQKSDPVISNYMRVVKNAAEKTKTGTLKDALDVRKVMDDAYENARGKLAYGSDKISALDDVHQAGRDALYNYLVEKSTGVDVRASLKNQWDLYRAADVLRAKAEIEAGSSVGRFAQNNPVLSKILQGGAKAAAVATGVSPFIH